MTRVSILLLVAVIGMAQAKVVFRPKGFVKLPTSTGAMGVNLGTANKAAYDTGAHLLYVVGHKADVMHVLDMKDSLTNPVLARTLQFDAIKQGLPNDVKVCRAGMGREFLAVSFESKDLTEKGHVHFYQLMADPKEALIRLKTVTTVEGYDPRSMAWDSVCNELVVASMGNVHTVNGVFEDPMPSADVLMPSWGLNVNRRNIPFSEAAIKSAGVREVFTTCDSGSHTAMSSHVQDLEPSHVTVDANDVAYMLFQSNNAIGRLNLKDPFAPMTYHNLGMKDWNNLKLDTSDTDGGIHGYQHHIKSLYQPGHATTFTLGNKTWLATADGGHIKQYAVRSGSTTLCNFDESSVGSSWRQAFSSQVDSTTEAGLQKNLTTSTAKMRFSRLKTFADGYNPLQQGYNGLLTYGGRGWSILDTTSMQRVYDSGDALEQYFTTSAASDIQKAVYNSYYPNNNGYTQAQNVDKTSPMFGPNPTAITSHSINETAIVVVANGYMGGLYIFSVTVNATTSSPEVAFEGFGRRGSPGLTWAEAYAANNDAVGEPGITDLIWVEDSGQHVVVAVSSIAGAVSVYQVDLLI